MPCACMSFLSFDNVGMLACNNRRCIGSVVVISNKFTVRFHSVVISCLMPHAAHYLNDRECIRSYHQCHARHLSAYMTFLMS